MHDRTPSNRVARKFKQLQDRSGELRRCLAGLNGGTLAANQECRDCPCVVRHQLETDAILPAIALRRPQELLAPGREYRTFSFEC